MAEFDYDLFVIGAGSGGVRASRIAASHGARVAVAEDHRIGGTCVIRGCVPKKMLVYGAHFADALRDAAGFGWTLGETSFDWGKLRDFVASEVTRIEGAYTQTLDTNKVDHFHEHAAITGPHSVRLASGRAISAKYILVAVGAWPVMPDFPGNQHCITSNEVFALASFPKRVVIQGAGYIAMEFAGIFNALGAEVTVVNRSDQILRGYDESLRDRLLEITRARGIEFRFDSPIERVDPEPDGSLLVHTRHGALPADVVLVATGRKPKTEGLGLETAGIALGAKGQVPVDEWSATSCPSIYAVGDVTDRVQLTPVAIREGQAFADSVFGGPHGVRPHSVSYEAIPNAAFTQPPLAGVGLTEVQAREKLGNIKVFRSDFRPMLNM